MTRPAPPRPGQLPLSPPPEVDLAGDASVLARLAGLDGQPLSEHVAVYGQIHQALQQKLATVDGV